MKEVFYSEILKKYFNDRAECEKAEKEYEEKHALELKAKEERTNRAKEVEEAYKKYVELRNAFIKDYHQWHMTYDDGNFKSFFDYFFEM
ncbi:MAG: hypothetical protein IJH34_04800 [Romboutsia sp.]|nr:hypothetical protein [Romboutsia sp.]